jgi:hypothetical protein
MRVDLLSLNEAETLGLFVLSPKFWITCFSSPTPCIEELVQCVSEPSRLPDECTVSEYEAVGRGRMLNIHFIHNFLHPFVFIMSPYDECIACNLYIYNSFRKEKSLTSNALSLQSILNPLFPVSLTRLYNIRLYSSFHEVHKSIHFRGGIYQCFHMFYLWYYRTNVCESHSRSSLYLGVFTRWGRTHRARWRSWRQMHEMWTGFSTRIHGVL